MKSNFHAPQIHYCKLKYTLLYKQQFYKQQQAKLEKNQAKLSNTLSLNFCYFKIICILHPRYHQKNDSAYSKETAIASVSVLMRLYH